MRILLTLSLFFICTYQGFTQNTSEIDELKSNIESIFVKSKTPAVAITIVRGDSVLLATAFGDRNLETKEEADEHTLFRIGSISKMFVALSVLKLQEEGKLSLQDRLKDWAPEIMYENPWEDTNPVLIAHLLEHTTGWDDIHLAEYGHNETEPISLKDALDFHPHSRVSRWIPGTRHSYCNSGPPVAAYIVEKITNQNFEDYVQTNFFDPLGMETATYFNNDKYEANGVTLYKGKQPQPYWNIIMRASGSINASAIDMAQMVRFFIRDAVVDSTRIINQASLDRMETPMTTIGANVGLETGYGLNNYSSNFNGFPFQGHNGGVNGGSSVLAYNRGHNIGFVVMVNSNNSNVRTKIAEEIAKYLTKELQPQTAEFTPVSTQAFDGYYYPINPRQQMNHFTSRLFNIKKIWSDDSLIYMADYPSNSSSKFRPINDQLAYGTTNQVALVLAEDPIKGKVVATGWGVFAPISLTAILFSWGFVAFWIIGLLTSGVWFIVTIIRLLIGSEKPKAMHFVQLGPVIIAICLILFFGFLAYGGIKDPFQYLGKPTAVSLTIYFASLLIGIISFLSLGIDIYLYRKVSRNFTFWFFTVLSFMSVIATFYLWNHGTIGLKTWG